MNKLKFLLILVVAFCATDFGFAQVGINTTTPLSTLDINGNLNVKEIGIINSNVSGSAVLNGGPSGAATAINDGVYISLTPTMGNVEFILPNAVNVPGRIYILRNISDTVTAQLYTFGGLFFSKGSNMNTASPLTLPPNAIGKSIIIISDGANWTFFN
ncbi:hypothetical protein [Flavobacterium dankookense]|uniref:Uncharacterized protein n=1 Tax=Flavobacterium dankookense TaxID=706186 RepID=A0A4R6QC82_9FLAO|nr:hypothetical protein [Flavobacterium dankookense]TDP59925.1 hypothetical protein BC748_0894 [Flavobacterium dankookense]